MDLRQATTTMSNMDVDKIEPSSTTVANPAPPTNYAADFNQAVCRAIEEHKQSAPGSARFSSPDKLTPFDTARLLGILMLTRTCSDNMDTSKCVDYLTDRQQLQSKLEHVYASQAFAEMLNDADMPPDFHKGPPRILSIGSNRNLKSAFEEPYLEDIDDVFIRSLNDARESYSRSDSVAKSPYNWSIAVIQSSGTGKSRMMEQVGNKVFTISINLREKVVGVDGMNKTFPPPDDVLHNYFAARTQLTNNEQQGDYAVFLLVLFDTIAETIETRWEGMRGQDLALAWAGHMKEGLTAAATGEIRQSIYASVRNNAENLRKGQFKDKTILDLAAPLRESCDHLTRIIYPDRPTNANAFLVYFDEAHVLTVPNNCPDGMLNRSAYHNLGSVLAVLNDKPVFFVFLSTSSRLEHYAPSPQDHPSRRTFDGSVLIPPFNELPFDLYERQVLKQAGPLTLNNMCKLKVMVGFGRPLWYAQYKTDATIDIFKFALEKLTAGNAEGKQHDAAIAALGVLIGISFDSKNFNVVDLESRLVNSHMRVSYSIPRDRSYMHTGSPSEPVLAEAAARLLDNADDARGERGELSARLLAICAYTISLEKLRTLSDNPRYHKPVPLLDWLCALFGEQFHDTILGATPVADQAGSQTLKEQFSGAYVFFSHFALADDKEMLTGRGLATALMRGMAIQCKDNQASIDAVIPIHMGSLDTPISVKTCSAINLQIKNRKQAEDCPVDRTITVPKATTPAISIVFELGVTDHSDVVIRHQRHPVTRAAPVHPDDKHYTIVAYGISSEVFGAIPSEVATNYKSFLGRETILGDFPRKHLPENVEMLRRLNPSFNGKRQERRYAEWFA
ncbi:G2/mitotic-specific cyclin cdc13 [Ceratobasidium sp. AG-Ba]|nr:G2/mitotic-specific cyclin cdc13 [Ceratobasidium sp. AG-Ba]